MKKKRDRIGYVLYGFYLLLLVLSAGIIVKIIWLQTGYRQDPKIASSVTKSVSKVVIEPRRGDILDCNGRMLALSYPMYEIGMDCSVMKQYYIDEAKDLLRKAKTDAEKDSALRHAEDKEKLWMRRADSLSRELPAYFPEKNAGEYYRMIKEGRDKGKQYIRLGHLVDWKTCSEIQNLPLFRQGQYEGGFIKRCVYVREYPYESLGRRTIGHISTDKKGVTNTHTGLEGKFDAVLHGQPGYMYVRRTDHGRMMESDSAVVHAVDGKDLRTTINIDYQEIADKALREHIASDNDIDGACLVLMETKTGAIRAMVNLVRNEKTGRLEESRNYAVGRIYEPGSVFKTVTLLSVLNDGKISSLEKTYPATDGKVPGTDIEDDHIPKFARRHHCSNISVIEGFRISSNYVFGRLAVDSYGDNPTRFTENIYTYKLGEVFDFDIDGLEKPTIPSGEGMKRNALGRMGFGYLTRETPLHLLTFYNAIANKGRMMKPYLVEDTEIDGKVCEKNGPAELAGSICSRAIADTMMRALRAVSEEDGTARRSLKGVKCPVAGKTGTSFGTFVNGVRKDGTKIVEYRRKDGKKQYNCTFVGFFPADGAQDPAYSIICAMFSFPTGNTYSGGGIPAKVVKEVVNGIHDVDPCFRDRIEKKQ